ncbi:MAG: pilus assembly protein [Armatimonadota bacterium]|nr:pilus assembly protein [Armatimonadota bacterium]MDR7463308.1 pilus assembly protein [Armatimonadota bacterium]MDR7468958.1 pilus assembly protein [Armatimonadota bacterium]MDR7474003.1 pilus assembly protein [Armatimonadota bacterium]MDR7537998.1 pilus assembly protein [Armatimonadota bacterium]
MLYGPMKKCDDHRGQVAVELVLLTPLLLLLLFLIFEFGRVFGSWLIVTNAAREGARFGIVQDFDVSADPAIRQRVQQTAQFLSVDAVPCAAPYNSCIQITRSTDGLERLVTVTVRYKVYTLMPITGDIPFIGRMSYPGYLEVTGQSTMRWE